MIKFYSRSLVLRITEFMNFIHRPEFLITKNTTFRKLLPSSGEGKEKGGPVIEVSFSERTQNNRCLPPLI
jgi:hypothetical protein